MRIWRFVVLGGFLLATSVYSNSHAAGFQVIHAFAGGSDGQSPEAGLSADNAGNLFGTTFGEKQQGVPPGKHCSKSCGGVYGYQQGGSLQGLYSFGGKDGANAAGTVLVTKGDVLYGTTQLGGTGCGGFGCGTVFKLKPDGTHRVLYSFCPTGAYPCPDGAYPRAGLIRDDAGNLYGTTTDGGNFGSSCPGA